MPNRNQSSYSFSIPEMTAQCGDIDSFSDFWSFGINDQGRRVVADSAVLREVLEILKDIFESNIWVIFIYLDIGVEDSSLLDILEDWILQENIGLIFFHESIGSIRYQNLYSILKLIDIKIDRNL